MRDMTNSRATICVAIRYIIRSTLANGNFDAEKDTSREKTHRARLENRPPDHGAARPPGPALVLAHPVGAARRAADLAALARGLRRGFADGAAGAAVGTARGGFCRAASLRRLWPDGDRPGTGRHLPAAASFCRTLEQAVTSKRRRLLLPP